MAQGTGRILLIDSSVVRAQSICDALAKAGWEIWPGRNVQDALVLAAGLPFNAVVAHESLTRLHPELWEQLSESVPQAFWLVHAEDRTRNEAGGSERVLGSDPALIVAILILLFDQRPVARAQAA